MEILLLDIKKLRPHEEVNSRHLKEMEKKILANQKIKKPIIVDKKSFTILDGHHRVAVIQKLGFNKIPVYLVNYSNPKIRVLPRRCNLRVSKKIVLLSAKSRSKLPSKSTRHLFPQRPFNCHVPLEFLT